MKLVKCRAAPTVVRVQLAPRGFGETDNQAEVGDGEDAALERKRATRSKALVKCLSVSHSLTSCCSTALSLPRAKSLL